MTELDPKQLELMRYSAASGPEYPAVRQAAERYAYQHQLVAAAHVDDCIGAHLAQGVDGARIHLHPVALACVKVGDPVQSGLREGVKDVGPCAARDCIVAQVPGEKVGAVPAAQHIV